MFCVFVTVNPLAKLFCASLVFVGLILLFLGHRWLNFTMFTSGFLFSWCVLFLLFAQASSNNIDGKFESCVSY